VFNRLAALIALSTFAAPALAQGDNGFLRGKDKLDLVFSFHWDDFPEVRDLGGGDSVAGSVERELWNVYAAYGLSHSIDVNLNASHALASGDDALGASDQGTSRTSSSA
jgi:hypothetical protein